MKKLREELSSEQLRNQGLEKELKDLKSCCHCSQGSPGAVTSNTKPNTKFESQPESEVKSFDTSDEVYSL